MKTRIPSLTTARTLGRFALFAIAFGLLVAGAPKAEAATIVSFTPGATKLTADFTGLSDGTSISTLGWTTSTYTPFYTGTSAKQPGSAPSNRVITVAGTGNSQNVTGPAFTSPFSSSETVYLQSSINRGATISSGARVLVRSGANNLVGFGIVNSGSNAFVMYANGGWITSTEVSNANKWYDLRLVIDVNTTDITLSVGHLFVRNVTDGETQFRLLDGLSNINLGFTSSANMSTITNWRIENARYDVQIGNLIGGVGSMVIPEPQAAAMLGLVALLGLSSKFRSFFQRH